MANDPLLMNYRHSQLGQQLELLAFEISRLRSELARFRQLGVMERLRNTRYQARLSLTLYDCKRPRQYRWCINHLCRHHCVPEQITSSIFDWTIRKGDSTYRQDTVPTVVDPVLEQPKALDTVLVRDKISHVTSLVTGLRDRRRTLRVRKLSCVVAKVVFIMSDQVEPETEDEFSGHIVRLRREVRELREFLQSLRLQQYVSAVLNTRRIAATGFLVGILNGLGAATLVPP